MLLPSTAAHINIDASPLGALNLTIYSGLYGGKWCFSIYDPPPPAGQSHRLSLHIPECGV